jgi:putative DNA primase/helicase
LIIVSNNKPLIRETKHAIWRRIRLVPFTVIIPEAERDTKLTEKLKAEWPGILAWLIEGYRDWQQNGIRTPHEVLMATQSYQSEQDPLGDYLSDRCICGMETTRISRNELYTDYMSWCHQTNEKFPLSRNALFDHIRALKGVGEDQWRVTGQSSPVRGFRGIGLSYAAPGVADFGG